MVGTFLVFAEKVFLTPLKGGEPPKKLKFKVLANICCGYSKLVSQDAWHNAKGIGSIRSSCPEKTSKMWSDFAVLGRRQNIPINIHVLDVFSGQGDQIDLIPFALC